MVQDDGEAYTGLEKSKSKRRAEDEGSGIGTSENPQTNQSTRKKHNTSQAPHTPAHAAAPPPQPSSRVSPPADDVDRMVQDDGDVYTGPSAQEKGKQRADAAAGPDIGAFEQPRANKKPRKKTRRQPEDFGSAMPNPIIPPDSTAEAMSQFYAMFGRAVKLLQNDLRGALDEQGKQIQKDLDSLRATINGAPKNCGPGPTANESKRTSRRQRRQKEKDIDTLAGHTQWARFRHTVRYHFMLLLNTSFNALNALPPPFTDQEIEDFDSQREGCIVITADEFRFDFTRPVTSLINEHAIDVFAHDLRQSILLHGWYSHPSPFDKEFIEIQYIKDSLCRHLRYAKSKYHHTVVDPLTPAEIDLKLKAAARSTRKTNLTYWRTDLVAEYFPEHLDFIEKGGSALMSSDESASELDPDGLAVVAYDRVYPIWRSLELSEFLWNLDKLRRLTRQPRVGTRSVSGAPPRIRRHSQKVREDAVAPPGLHSNCYTPAWLKRLRDFERDLLKVVSGNYPFTLNTGLFDPVPGLAPKPTSTAQGNTGPGGSSTTSAGASGAGVGTSGAGTSGAGTSGAGKSGAGRGETGESASGSLRRNAPRKATVESGSSSDL
ncbi:hypothetical protein BV25DRAFT_1912114 [Artomyces pyxidatus]|uniref:Uncharacterized protein n=1 Tax=Artomyces pyxidatus TaxID=48021 RepID=A0ACB8TGH4_9AGAM|nr:hypothetical protein BV25DRAFT_1912114 [Artomyces pyxidatus]